MGIASFSLVCGNNLRGIARPKQCDRVFSWGISSPSALGNDRQSEMPPPSIIFGLKMTSVFLQVGLIYKGNEAQIPL